MESVSERIREYDEQIESIGKSRYPETELLKHVHGVGTLTALTYVLTVDDPYRFHRSRDAGAYFGLRPLGESLAIAGRSYGLPRKAIRICENCWCSARITFWSF